MIKWSVVGIATLAGIVGLLRHRHKNQAKQQFDAEEDRKLDQKLAESMDCSDATADFK